MVFSSEIFLFGFLPFMLFGYHTIFRKSRISQNVFLCIGSLLFYAWGEPIYVILMLISILFNWYFGMMISNHRKEKHRVRSIIIVDLVLNIGILFVFKYMGFVLENVNILLGTNFIIPSFALPIGISFFTFQAISYVLDVYRGENPQKNPLYVALYISSKFSSDIWALIFFSFRYIVYYFLIILHLLLCLYFLYQF